MPCQSGTLEDKLNKTLFPLTRFWIGILAFGLFQYLLRGTDFRHTSPIWTFFGGGFVAATYTWFLLEGAVRTALEYGAPWFDRALVAMIALPSIAILVVIGIATTQGRGEVLSSFLLGSVLYYLLLREPVVAIFGDVGHSPARRTRQPRA